MCCQVCALTVAQVPLAMLSVLDASLVLGKQDAEPKHNRQMQAEKATSPPHTDGTLQWYYSGATCDHMLSIAIPP